MQQETIQVIQKELKVCFFVDGFTLRKVNDYYRFYHAHRSSINFLGFKHWAGVQASRCFWPDCSIDFMAHYYHPYRDPSKETSIHSRVSLFADELLKAGFNVHYGERNYASELCPNLELTEDALLYAKYKKMDALILATTQGQYAELPLRLKNLNVPTLLLGWDFVYPSRSKEIHWHTDQNLRKNSAYYIAMERIMNVAGTSSDVLAKGLFLERKKRIDITACRGVSSDFQRGMSRLA
ncbi:MAG: NYN domain-containing protein [Fibrobacteraceae bacterium]